MTQGRVLFIDTSVFCNILPVPGRDQDRDRVLADLKVNESTATLVLPVTTVIETGNFIAQLATGGERRSTGARFVQTLKLISLGRAPWALHEFDWDASVIEDLINGCGTGRPLQVHAEEKVGAGDLAILAEMRSYSRRVQSSAVEIWTLDGSLGAYGLGSAPLR